MPTEDYNDEKNLMKQQQGFTLIELVMVIVILGILSAVAMPKFIDLQGSARLSSLSGALGAVKSASSIAHSAWLVASPADNVIVIEGNNYTMKSKIRQSLVGNHMNIM
mgnify:CR=1 FL=1